MRTVRTVRIAAMTAGGALALLCLAACGGTTTAGPAPATTASPAVRSTTPGSTALGTTAPGTILPSMPPRSVASSCHDQPVTAAVLTDLVRADMRGSAAELPGHTFYGVCGARSYAVAAMVAGPLATLAEQDSFGHAPPTAEFFSSATGGRWAAVGRSSGRFGCSGFAIPSGLRSLWGDCHVALHHEPPGPAATTSQGLCRQVTGSRSYLRVTRATVHSGDGVTVVGVPEGVHCGGPDDIQYGDIGSPETLHLTSGAVIGVFSVVGSREVPEPVAALEGYLSHPELGIFEVYGHVPDLVTGLAEQYHP